MSRPKRPPRAWIGPTRPVDPTELLGPRGLTEELLNEVVEEESNEGDRGELVINDNQFCALVKTGGQPIAPASSAAFAAPTDAFYRSLLTDERLARIESVIAARLCSVTVVLDRLLDPHNVAAILRSAEGMGIGSAQIVANEDAEKNAHRRVTRDADKWLELAHPATGAEAARSLVARGFSVFAGHLGEGSLLLHDLPIDKPLALLFGNEHEGPGQETIAACTGSFRIPMAGFTQSFNVSVAAAIALFGVAQRRRAFLGRPGDLDEREQALLRSRFLRLAASIARRIRNIPGTSQTNE